MTFQAQYRAKKSFFFDGLNTYMSKSSPGAGAANCNPEQDEDFSISFWCQSGSSSAELAIYSNNYANGTNVEGFAVRINSGGNLQLNAEGSDGVTRKRYSIFNRPFNTTNVGYWHGVVTYSGATIGAAIENTQFYIEGGLVEGSGSGAIGTIANSTHPIELGRRGNSVSGGTLYHAGYFEGSLTHIAFFNKVLSAEEVREIFVGRNGARGPGNLLRHSAASNLKGYWIADNPSDAYNGTVYDQSGNSKDMTPSNFASAEHYVGGP